MEKGVTEITDIVFSNENEERIEKEEESVEAKEIGSGEEEEEKKNSVGIFNKFISNLVSPKVEQDSSSLPEARNGGDDGDERESGTGLIDNIVSHLPSSPLADDAAPATEEASILIHSIVHD